MHLCCAFCALGGRSRKTRVRWRCRTCSASAVYGSPLRGLFFARDRGKPTERPAARNEAHRPREQSRCFALGGACSGRVARGCGRASARHACGAFQAAYLRCSSTHLDTRDGVVSRRTGPTSRSRLALEELRLARSHLARGLRPRRRRTWRRGVDPRLPTPCAATTRP